MIDDFFTRPVPRDTKEKSIERFTRIRDTVNGDVTERERQDAYEEALFFLRDLVKSFIKRKYSSYLKNDPSFFYDLFQSSMETIISYIPGYDPSKGSPGTYFSLAIQNALYTETLKKAGRNRPQNQLIRKMKSLIDEYEKCGKTPTIESISKDLGKTPKQVRDILCLIGISEATCLDELNGYQDSIFSGDASRNEDYSVPEEAVVEKVSSEELYEKLKERMTAKEAEILRCIYDGTSYTKCGISKSEYRAFIKKCTDIIANDEDIHSLLGRD